jgi:muramidase (phage lysozyme)
MASAEQYRQLLQTSPTLRAFLNLIGWAEGANYNTAFGGQTFSSYAWHPFQQSHFRIRDPKTGRASTTSAAGKYQYQRGTWDTVARELGLRDFSPANQDIGAVHLLAKRGVLNDVLSGNIAKAVNGLKQEWQSFDIKPLSSVMQKWSQLGGSASTAPQVNVTAAPVDDYAQYTNAKVFGEENRYLIAAAILVIIFVFAFNN